MRVFPLFIRVWICVVCMAFMLPVCRIWAQGCSDAGICTIAGRYDARDSKQRPLPRYVRIGLSYGLADERVSDLSQFVEVRAKIIRSFSAEVKMISSSRFGNSLYTWSPADVFVNMDFAFSKNVNLLIGTKIPLNDGNTKYQTRPFPMLYQPSLGTWDAIVGVGVKVKKVALFFGYQQPITQNKNAFHRDQWADFSVLQHSPQTPSVSNYQRSGDIVGRIGVPFVFKRWQLTPSVLPVYRIVSDRTLDLAGKFVPIQGSHGLTLNVSMAADFNLNAHSTFGFFAAAPVVKRTIRPDGLTRSFVTGFEYKFRF